MEQPDQSKSEQIAAIFDSYVLVLFFNGWDYSCSYDHSNNKPSQIWTSNCMDFEWILILNVQYSSHHCN